MVDIIERIKQRETSRIIRQVSQLDLDQRPVTTTGLTDAEVDAIAAEFVAAMRRDVDKVEIPKEFPSSPPHTCGVTLTVATLWGDQTEIKRVKKRNIRGGVDSLTGEAYGRCAGCYHDHVVRIANQIISELERGNALYATYVENAKGTADKYRQRRKRTGNEVAYRIFPDSEGGGWCVNNQAEGEILPHNSREIHALVYRYAETPHGKRAHVSNGFGGVYQGNKGDGRRKAKKKAGEDVPETIQVWSRASSVDVIKKLEAKGLPMSKHANGGATVFTLAPTVLHILEEMGGWFAKGGGNISDILEGVTHKVQSTKSHMYLMRDILEVEGQGNSARPNLLTDEVETAHILFNPPVDGEQENVSGLQLHLPEVASKPDCFDLLARIFEPSTPWARG